MPTDFRENRSESALWWAAILGRTARPADEVWIAGVAGRRVLVTGAGGFIGGEMVRRLCAADAARVVLLESAERPLFEIHREMSLYGSRCVPVLGSVCDRGLLDEVFEEHRPELVLHAAALKHVPLMERNPLAAMENNGLGTWRLARAAEEHGARAMILVSTDKAVAPRSIMGAAKRVAELAMPAQGEGGGMRCAAVRLANVIGSPCSVGPLFQEQIARGGPVTVTHREAKRFFLTLEEVAGLLGEAMGSNAAKGVLAPDPGEPVRIEELARRMMAACGRQVPVMFTELRPGEKLDEALIGPEEEIAGAATRGLRRVAGGSRSAGEARMSAMEEAVAARDVRGVLRLLDELVPNYEPSAVLRESVAEGAGGER